MDLVESMQIVKVPYERVKILQKYANEIERFTRVKLNIEDEDVIINGDPYDEWRAIDIVKAIGRGFSLSSAFKLLNDEYILKIINLKEIFHRENQRRRCLARVIGTKGMAKKKIEEITGAEICIYKNTIGIIGKLDEATLAERAMNMLIRGVKHGSVYFIIKKEKMKAEFGR